MRVGIGKRYGSSIAWNVVWWEDQSLEDTDDRVGTLETSEGLITHNDNKSKTTTQEHRPKSQTKTKTQTRKRQEMEGGTETCHSDKAKIQSTKHGID